MMMNKDFFRELYTDRLVLKKIEDSDIKYLYRNIYSNFEFYKYYDQRKFSGLGEYTMSLIPYNYYYAQGNYFKWGLLHKEANILIGEVSLDSCDKNDINNKFNLRYILSYKSLNQGYATEAVNSVIDFAFNQLDAHRIQAQIVTENVAALRLAQRVGMSYEGTMTDSYKIDKEYYDQDVFSIVNPKHKVKSIFR